jgi:hypothetical protein
MRKLILPAYLLILSAIATSCCKEWSLEKELDSLSIYMDKKDVMQKMSTRGVARGSIINKYNQTIEVREYLVGSYGPQDSDLYWLYFCDGKLVQWGKAGDWAQAQRTIYDINFKVSLEKQGNRDHQDVDHVKSELGKVCGTF